MWNDKLSLIENYKNIGLSSKINEAQAILPENHESANHY